MNSRSQDAEVLAAAFLEQNGLCILERNYRSHFGEIDLLRVTAMRRSSLRCASEIPKRRAVQQPASP